MYSEMNQNQTMIQEAVQQKEDAAAERGSGTRGKYQKRSKPYWSIDEDISLINGWLQNSADLKAGGTNWVNITLCVNEKEPDQSCLRNLKSCKNRWSGISSSVGKFISAMTEARKIATDGMSETDIWDLANKLYWDDTKVSFTLTHAYNLLHAAPRFLEAYCTKQKMIGNSQLNVIRQSSEGSSKRLRLNDGGEHSASTNSGAPKVGDFSTPLFSARPVAVGIPEEQGIGDEQFMQDIDILKDPVWNNSQVSGADWKDVKLQEIQATKEAEERRLEFEREKEASQMQPGAEPGGVRQGLKPLPEIPKTLIRGSKICRYNFLPFFPVDSAPAAAVFVQMERLCLEPPL